MKTKIIIICLLLFLNVSGLFFVFNKKAEKQNINIIQENVPNNDQLYLKDDFIYKLYINDETFKVRYGKGDDYYLSHDNLNKKAKYGSIFILENNNLDSELLFICGHSSSKKDVMFSFIKNYEDLDYYQKHQFLFLENNQRKTKYQIISLMIIDENNSDRDWYNLDLKKEDKTKYLNGFINNSDYLFCNNIRVNKKLVVLITCNLSKDNHKYLLLANEI